MIGRYRRGGQGRQAVQPQSRRSGARRGAAGRAKGHVGGIHMSLGNYLFAHIDHTGICH